MGSIAFNARFNPHNPTGMQRYALEVSRRFESYLYPVRPKDPLRGMSGHLWEQLYLPTAVRGRFLWSPINTGPLAVTRHVCTIHDLIPLDRPEWFNARFAGWYRWLMPRLAARLQHIIAVSGFTKQRIIELLKVREENITVIPNGVDQRFKPRPAEEVEQVCRTFGIRRKSYVLSVGSLEPRKNLHRLLEAWRTIHTAIPPEIDLVVTGAQGSALVFRSVSLQALPPRVHFTGYVEDEQLPALYSGALVFVYPSLYEGFGLPPLEAMACGTPVVTSQGSSLGEVVGNAAILVDPYRTGAIADGMLEAISDSSRLESLRRSGLERVRHLTWDRTASETLRLLLQQARAA
jgi:glycosyltransferase involved in cell wall biosynthesis